MGTSTHFLTQTAAFVETEFKREGKQPASRSFSQELSGATDSATLSSLLKQCGRTKALDDGKLLHSEICKFLGVHNTFLGNCLVEMYGACGDVSAAASTFNLISELNLYSWNILINAYAKNGHSHEALQAYLGMQESGFTPTPRTFVSVLSAVDVSVTLDHVWEIHSAIIDSGYIGQVIVCTALINAYAKNRSLLHANIVFDEIPVKDVISWNAMLAACNENDSFHDTLALFQRMRCEGFEPNHITFTCTVDACANIGSLHSAKEVYSLVNSSGYFKNQIIGNALLNMYGKCGSLEDARSVFLQMPHHDVISWSSMIAACVENGNDKEGLELFYQMQNGDIEPNAVTFVCAMEACGSRGLLEEAKNIHALVSKSRFSNDLVVLSSLITMYGKCKSPGDAKHVFDQVVEPNLVTWNAMISMYVRSGYHTEALDLFTAMQSLEFKPNHITFVCVLDACASLANFQEGQKINDLVAGSDYQNDVMVSTALVNMFGNCGDIQKAEFIFHRTTKRDVILWSSMASAYVHTGCDEKALELFHQMQLSNVVPDSVTFVCALNACSNLSCLKEGLEFHTNVVKLGYETEIQVANALIDMYGKCGNLDCAREVFTKMTQRDFVMWNTMVAVCAQNGNGEEAVALFCEMQKAEIEPDAIAFISVLSACNHMGNVDDARRFFGLMKDYGIQQSLEHCHYIIDLLGRAGHIDDAEALIDSLPFENASKLWLALLGACITHGNVEQAKRIATCALQSDPDNPTIYVLLSNMCSAANIPPKALIQKKHG